ncbi:MAG: hypothetical protein K2P49_05475, partial [Oscillospiraceae bacterium]|nr:hypothetical protein [Oscillospiraceae bacterium]
TVVRLYTPERYPDLMRYFAQVGSAPNMVLDRETSYLPAFSRSDAQISDHSSLMQQYLPMDKPLLWVETLAPSVTKREFISTSWMERASGGEEILQFLNRVATGTDVNAQLRKQVYAQELPMADGCCGARVCQRLWDCLHREDGLTGWKGEH